MGHEVPADSSVAASDRRHQNFSESLCLRSVRKPSAAKPSRRKPRGHALSIGIAGIAGAVGGRNASLLTASAELAMPQLLLLLRLINIYPATPYDVPMEFLTTQ